VASVRCKNCGYDNLPEARFCANCGSNLADAIGPSAPSVMSPAGTTPEAAVAYMGFWIRLAAAIIDIIIVSVVSFALWSVFFGTMVPFSLLLLWLYHWLFIGLKGQTPGKMAVGIKVVDSRGFPPGLGNAALREVPGKIISYVVIYLGFLWIIWDQRKQGWHDKIANTYVVRVELRR
jgi:uncharacterized RDD family membrane protein YckC